MPVRELPRIPAEEMEKLKASKYVESVDTHMAFLTLDFHLILYQRWKDVPTANELQKTMEEYGINPDVLGIAYVKALLWDFQTYGDPTARPVGGAGSTHSPERRRNDVALLATGIFYVSNRGFQWEKELRKEMRSCYPEMSIEDCLIQAGIDPRIVGKSRIHCLRHHFRVYERRKQKEQENSGTTATKEEDHPVREYNAFRHAKNPYVDEVTGRYDLCMKDAFYNEISYLDGVSMEEILGIYGIDTSDLSAACIARIRAKRNDWKLTDARCVEWTDTVCHIQAARLSALISRTEEGFSKIREAAGKLSPIQKKELCRQVSRYLTVLNYPYGYSLREILGKVGISKTVYYKALNDSRYGLADERRKERDSRDLEKIMYVMEYKGFEKGIRQIYMMMPDLKKETFAISKIRRLLRKAGLKTKVRGENPARQRMDKFLEKNRKPNLLRREFRLHRPNEVRLTDVTYLDYGVADEKKKRAYGSSCIDPVTGKLLVFHVSENNDLELALGTLERLSDYPAVEGALFHSDQGILYFTDEFQEKVAEMGMTQSMSKRGNCWDNAPQESFFGHFKDECRYGSCESFGQLKAMIDEYAWYYNNERHQWDRKRMTPVRYEEYLLSLDEEGFAEYMRSEQEKYDKMKAKAQEKAVEKAKTLGV